MEKFVYGVILAAGKSSRMGGKDKILEKLANGMEVIINTIYKLDVVEVISEILVVSRGEIIDNLRKLINKYKFNKKIHVIEGGKTRTQSLFLGFEFVRLNLKAIDDSYFIVHDGARPLITKKDITNCLETAFKYDVATVGTYISDTIKRANKLDIENNISVIDKTIDRTNLFYIQTPQIFKFGVLKRAVENAKEKKLEFTDDCQLVEAIGEKVYIVEGSKLNIKITTQEDLLLVNKILGY